MGVKLHVLCNNYTDLKYTLVIGFKALSQLNTLVVKPNLSVFVLKSNTDIYLNRKASNIQAKMSASEAILPTQG